MSVRTRPFVLLATLLLFATVSWSPVAQAADVSRVVEALPGGVLRFRPDTISVQPGDRVTIRFFNNDSIAHTFDIDEFNVHTGELQPGENTTVTFTVPQITTAQYYCAVSGHRAAGMFGTLQAAPPETPLDITLIIVIVLVVAVVLGAVALLLRKRGGKKA